MIEQEDNQENTVTSSNTGGKQTPIDPEERKAIDDTKSDAKSSAKPEASPGSGFISAKDEPTQTEEQFK
jgi:cell division septation protein DedD